MEAHGQEIHVLLAIVGTRGGKQSWWESFSTPVLGGSSEQESTYSR